MSDKQNELVWNEDLITLLKSEFPNLGIFKGRILKDIFLQKGKNKIILQIEDNKSKTKKIEYKPDKDSNNLPTTYQAVDYSYEFEQKKRKIQKFTAELKGYDYSIMMKEIETFLEDELGMYILL